MIVPEEALQRCQRYVLLDGCDAEGVAEDVRAYLARNVRAVRDRAHDALKGLANAQGVVESEVSLKQWLQSGSERNHPPFSIAYRMVRPCRKS